MITNRLARINWVLVLVVAIISLGVLAEGAVIVTQLRASSHSQAPARTTTEAGPKQGAHPCNHGFYVSQAAHAKKGGGYVKQIAQSDLGKNGDCSAPLPAPATNTKSNDSGADD